MKIFTIISKTKTRNYFKFIIILLFISLPINNSLAWDGFDYENDTAVEIGKGNLVRKGNIIKIYDWKADEYHDVEIKSIETLFNVVRLEVHDLDTGQDRVLEMEN